MKRKHLIERFRTGEVVRLREVYCDDTTSFPAGKQGKVSGHDGILVVVTLAEESAYRVAVQPHALERIERVMAERDE